MDGLRLLGREMARRKGSGGSFNRNDSGVMMCDDSII